MPFCEERVRSYLVFSFRPVALSLIDQSSSQITEEVFTSLRQRTPCQTRGEYLSEKNWDCRFWIFGILKLSARMFIGFFFRTVYQILFTLSNDENKYHHWWFTNLKTLKKTRKSGHICASLTCITWISCDSCITFITCTKEISHQLILWDIIHIRRGVRSDAQLSPTETRFQKCSQSGKNGSEHPMLSISMAYNMISCKKVERNTQKLKIADFTM